MVQHAVYKQKTENIRVAILDSNPVMADLMVQMFEALAVKQVVAYTRPEDALTGMMEDPPHLAIIDWRFGPQGGTGFVEQLRHKSLWPICFTSVIMLSKRVTHTIVSQARAAGAHQVMAKPVTVSALHERLMWLVDDERTLENGALDLDAADDSRTEKTGDKYAISGLETCKLMPAVPYAHSVI